MKRICLHLLVVGYTQLYVLVAQIFTPLHFLNEGEKADIRNSSNSENFSVVTAFLRRNKFKVLEFEDGSLPLVLQGDIAVPADEIVTNALEGRTTTLEGDKDHRWKVGNAAPHVHYFQDSTTKPDADLIHKAVKAWMDNTCIRFTELPRGACNQTSAQAAVCVRGEPFAGCWSSVGRRSAPDAVAQKLTLGVGCDMHAGIHEFGHVLGLSHMQSRSDRDQFISVHPEHLRLNRSSETYEEDLRHRWAQGRCQMSKDEFDLPAPYDYMSIMQYDFIGFGDEDVKGYLMTRDIRYQHMLLYKREANYLLSFYDLFIINTAYGCVKQWTKTCKANGKKVAKCENLGYVGVNCTCLCPPAFSGPSCSKKVGQVHAPLPKAQVQVEVTEARTVSFQTSQFTRQPPETHSERFDKYMQFITVVIRGENNTYAAVFVERDSGATSALRGDKGHSILVDEWQDSLTGQFSVTVLWGSSRRGNIRAEYSSSFLLNEPNGNWLRSRGSELDLMSRCGIGYWTGDDLSTRFYVSLRLHVSFGPRGDRHLKALECQYPSYCGRPAFVGALMSAVTSVTGIAVMAGVAGLVLLLVAVGVCCACKKKRQRDGGEDTDDEKAGSRDSDSTSSSSDTSSAAEGWFTRGGD